MMGDMTKNISIIFHHHDSFSKEVAKYISSGASQEGVDCFLFSAEEATNKLPEITNSDAIIFGSPTYFGSVASKIKAFMDSTTEVWQKSLWKNKIAAGFTHSSALSGDKLNALIQMFIFAQQHGMIWVGMDLQALKQDKVFKTPLNRLGSWSGLMVGSNAKGEDGESDMNTAKYFGMRIAKIVKNSNFNQDEHE